MKQQHGPAAIAAALALALALAACATPAGGNQTMSTPGHQPPTLREGGQQRFIVKYRAGTGPSHDPAAARQRLAATAPEGLVLTWRQRLGVQADLFTTDRPLGAEEAEALMRRFRADPDVEYIEPDGWMTIDPVRPRDLLREPG